MKESVVNLLTGVGFTGVEAQAYLALLREPGATGYRVSRIIGKPIPNTYKALDSLREKGAVVPDESARGRTYSALPIGEYLDARKRGLDEQRRSIEAEMGKLGTEPMAGGIYQLATVAQVYERVRGMLGAAKSVVLIDIFPVPLAEVKSALEAAARRGVKVLILTYQPVAVKGCEVIAPEKPSPHLEMWDGDWMNVVVDCAEYVHSLLKKNGAGVHRAVWTRDDYLAIQAFSGAYHEFVLNRLLLLLWHGKPWDEVKEELVRMRKRYVLDSPFYGVIRPWLKEAVLKEVEKERAGKAKSKGRACAEKK